MRQIVLLNNNWKYKKGFDKSYVHKDFDDSSFTEINLPHTNKEIPYNYFDEKMYQFVSCYRKTFTVPKGLEDKRIMVDFEGVMSFAKVYVNSQYVGEHKGGYTPFSFDITEYITTNEPNVLAVMVDSTERADIPPFGYVVDYLTYGGIYREVSLRIVDSVYIENVNIQPEDILKEKKGLSADVYCVNNTGVEQHGNVKVILKDGSNIICEKSFLVTLGTVLKNPINICIEGIDSVELWSVDSPKLYNVEIHLQCNESTDTFETKTGFRKAVFEKDGFYLNGEKIKIRGLNRHQSYPYVGYAMPGRVQKKDADILKYELGLNLVRTSHYPQSRYFLDRCDEIGLLVLEEIPGWQHIGDDEWKEVAVRNVEEMVKRDWNHPSIVLWGVRINESNDDHDFYTQTNKVARSLDSSRQTCGIRCITNSELLEDVYTMNDFVHSGGEIALRDQKEVTGLDRYVPYLVTEYNGHMYPTKRFDNEERQMEHTLRHVRVINAAACDQHISGSIGWCAFDYNTHMDFGSGDRICHHGVMDMFRIPKFAAFAYKSQMSPEKETVLEPVTVYARGERNIGGIVPLVVLTNCDFVDLYYGSQKIGRFYPDTESYPGLEHPPVIIKGIPGEWGMAWSDGELVGYIGQKEAIRRKYCANPVASSLVGAADDEKLSAAEMDATRVVYKLLDQYGNLIPYASDFVKLSIIGPGEIIGPDTIALIGGCIAVWVRTRNTKGEILLSASCSRFEANIIKITVE